jgi:hypothetical protein
MVDSSVRFQPATLPDAARILGVSKSTVRRLVKAGKLEAERILRPQGYVWMVMVPAPSMEIQDEPPMWIPPLPANPPEAPTTPPALVTWMTSVLEPLVVELGTSRQRIEELAREIGRLMAERDLARAGLSAAEETVMAARAPESPPVAPTAMAAG